jgi:hypothetical protein
MHYLQIRDPKRTLEYRIRLSSTRALNVGPIGDDFAPSHGCPECFPTFDSGNPAGQHQARRWSDPSGSDHSASDPKDTAFSSADSFQKTYFNASCRIL